MFKKALQTTLLNIYFLKSIILKKAVQTTLELHTLKLLFKKNK